MGGTEDAPLATITIRRYRDDEAFAPRWVATLERGDLSSTARSPEDALRGLLDALVDSVIAEVDGA